MNNKAAIFLSIAVVLAVPAHAQPNNVSPKVVSILKKAQAQARAGNYGIALGTVNKAEAVKSAPGDEAIIEKMKRYFEVKIADLQSPTRNLQP